MALAAYSRASRVGLNSQACHPVVEVGHRVEDALGRIAVVDVAAGEQRQCAEAGGPPQELAPRRPVEAAGASAKIAAVSGCGLRLFMRSPGASASGDHRPQRARHEQRHRHMHEEEQDDGVHARKCTMAGASKSPISDVSQPSWTGFQIARPERTATIPARMTPR